MLVQKPYHEPYIPNGPAGLPYVGAELESITSETPFWRGQGIPIYPFEERQYNQNRYYAGPLDRLKQAQQAVARAKVLAKSKAIPAIQNRVPTMVRPGQVSPEAFRPPTEESTGLSLGMKIGLGAVALVVVGVGVAKILD